VQRHLAAIAHRRGHLSDAGAVGLAAATAAGAWWSVAVPVAVAVVAVAIGLLARRPLVLVVGAALLASSLGARAWAGVAPPPAGPVSGEVTLAGDPVSAFGGTQVEARLGARRVQLVARGAAAGVLADRLAGERLEVAGRLGPVPAPVRERLARRHVSGRLIVEAVGAWSPGSAVTRLANGARRTLATGAAPLGDARPLFLGMVVGDDREQSVVVADDFEAAGLTHLLAVSGQNVAFVLVLAAPLLSRLGLRSRWLATVALIGFFALLTRFEPSVLRASAMAAIACTAGGLGRPASTVRVLALAVTAVLLLDPLLVGSLGFLLSVGASAGIVLLARPLADRLPGPRPLAALVGVTLAAQVGVAPVLLPVFGGLPVASLPANVLAVPVAAPLMMWGLTAGMAAGVVGSPLDGWLHLPTGVLVAWVAAVARWAASLPLGTVGPTSAVALRVIVAGAVLLRRRWSGVVPVALALALVSSVAPRLAPASRLAGVDGGSGATLWRAGGATVVVVDDPWVPGVLAELRDAEVEHIDVLVLRRGGRAVAGDVLELRQRVDARLVLAPDGHRVRDAVVPPAGRLRVGGLALDVTRTGPTLDVTVTLASSVRPRPP
jgi:competence protein ComEC